MLYVRKRLLWLAAVTLSFLVGCSDSDPGVAPSPNRSIVIPIELDYAASDWTMPVQGTADVPLGISDIDSVFFRWEGTAELGVATFGGTDPSPGSGPIFELAIRLPEMNALWLAEDFAGGPGVVSGEECLTWHHFVSPEIPPWELLVGKVHECTLAVKAPVLPLPFAWAEPPTGELSSASLVFKLIE